MTCLAAGGVALGGTCHVPLAIGEASARQSDGGGGVLEIRGIWEFEGLMQTDYPLSVLVTVGEDFVRYPLGKTPEAGRLGGLADGLQLDEVPALEAAGRLEPRARVLKIDEHRISIALPPDLGEGLLSVLLYRALDPERFSISRHEVRPASFSNTVATYYGAAS